MRLCDLQHARCGIDGCHAVCVRQAGGGLGEDAPAAADVEVFELLLGCEWGGEEAGLDEGVAQGVHEVEQA